ncbi:MAG: DUF2268 domain-containing putative Zn-dependent protease, partial [Flavisolibacter sp.]
MKKACLIFFFVSFFKLAESQERGPKVFTSDIDHFWTAFDSIQTTSDSLKQLSYIQTLYIDQGTPGLKAFMEAREYSAPLWIHLIREYPRFWRSVRPNTLQVKNMSGTLESRIEKLKQLYPRLREAKMFFTIGGLRSGGTTMRDMVLIGTEIAAATSSTDVSEFTNPWLRSVFQHQSSGNIVPLNIHEYVHTQQNGEPKNLLATAIKEGSADFITALVMEKPLQANYIQYGREHDSLLKENFKRELFTTNYNDWLYNGSNAKTVADLGYYVGYAICESYYNKAKNKMQAIKEIIELNYSDDKAVENFFQQSGYIQQPVEYLKSKTPVVARIEPFSNDDSLVDPAITHVRIIFSRPMDTRHYSMDVGEKGKEDFPITGVDGFPDSLTIVLQVKLQPRHDYEFILTNRSFRSEDGYLLKPYLVR